MLTHAIGIFPYPSHPNLPPLRTHLVLRDAPKSPYEKGHPRPWPGEGLDDVAHSRSCAVKAARDAKNKGHYYHFCRAVSFWLFFLVLCTLMTSFMVSRRVPGSKDDSKDDSKDAEEYPNARSTKSIDVSLLISSQSCC